MVVRLDEPQLNQPRDNHGVPGMVGKVKKSMSAVIVPDMSR
jgi:hypothetical protein